MHANAKFVIICYNRNKKKWIQKSSEINKILLTYAKGFPGDSVVKNLPADAGDVG